MKISPEQWRQIDPLLGLALEMEAPARSDWLLGLDQTAPQLAPLLRRMLASHDRAERSLELETVPKLAPPPPTSSDYAAGMRIGPYALLHPIGRGGMGEVWLARQVDGRIERELALKLPVMPVGSEVWRARFRRERDILARLVHPNIAQLFDAGVSEEAASRGQPYLAMEYVAGVSLLEHASAATATIEQRLRLFLQVLDAVAHAHRHLVVHRDLKPANILVDAGAHAKLLDFGIAKLIDSEDGDTGSSADLTRLGGRLLTLRYAAPEQLADGILSTATDIYALGVILHELLCGESPYRAVREGRKLTEAALLAAAPSLPSLSVTDLAARQRGLASAKALARRLAGDLDAITLKALRRDPAERYAAVEQFSEDIRRHLDHRPVAAREGTWRYLGGRFAARHKWPIAVAAAVLLTLAGGLALAEREHRLTVVEKARAEKHFSSVRKLANSFMFEMHDELAEVEGTLKARETLVRTSLQYLDSLAAEAGDDPGLIAELAIAYRKIAGIQGQLGAANTGQTGAAMANYEKSRRLFASLGDYRIDDIVLQREQMALRYQLAKAYARDGDARWLENYTASSALAERITRLNGATPADRSKLAGMYAEEAQLRSALIGPSAKGDALVERAVSLLETQLKEMPADKRVRATLAFAYLRAADNFTLNAQAPQRLPRAIAMREKSLAAFVALAREVPADPSYPKYIEAAQLGLAENLAEAGRLAEADRLIGEVLDRQLAHQAADPKDAGQRSAILATYAHATGIALKNGDAAKSLRLGRAALAQYAGTPAELRSVRDLRGSVAEIQAVMGEALLGLGARPAIEPGTRAAALREACPLLAAAHAFGMELRAANLATRDETDISKVEGLLTSCQAQLARLARS